MKKTKTLKIFPFNKGLDKSSTPGTQDPRSLVTAKNTVIRNRGSVRKAPGIRSIPYAGPKDGLQAAVHYFGTSGGAQFSEVVQVRKGRVEVIRDGNAVDLGLAVSPTDTVVFERFANRLIIHFENTSPKTYTSGATALEDLGILSTHTSPPPTFSKKHDFRLWYGGRGNFPHRLTISAIDDLSSYSLVDGGGQMRVREGDGDPVGLTGLSDTFRGDLYAFKWNSIHRIFNTGAYYGNAVISDDIGCVHHNTIVTLKNDIYFVSPAGIHSLANTDAYGAAEESTLSYPIYEYFQESVNWAASKLMVATYDSSLNAYLLAYPQGGSAVCNRVLGFNVVTKEFFEWEDAEYPVLGRYFDFGRKRTLVGCNDLGLGVLDEQYQERFGQSYDFQIKTGIIFPLDELHSDVTFTHGWLYVKPTRGDLNVTLSYWIDGTKQADITLNLNGGGEGARLDGTDPIDDEASEIVGHRENFKAIPFELSGDGRTIEFQVTHEPDGEGDQIIEIFGLIAEYEYNESSDSNTKAS